MSTQKTVLCHGVFDVLHVGHLQYLQAAREFGNRLIVSVTADQHVKKGPARPHFTAGQRAAMLKALKFVDEVVISDAPTAVEVIEQIRPDFYVKGPDYRNAEDDVTGEIHNEREAVERHGGRLVFTDTPTHSASKLVNAEFSAWNERQRETVALVNERGGYAKIRSEIEALGVLSVTVAGECIRDVYRYVEPQGISSKSPSLSTRFVREEISYGGIWAIVAHLRDFCIVHQWTSGIVHEKVRYIAGSQRLFEVCNHPADCRRNDLKCDSDVLLCADFGHGYFTRDPDVDCRFLALNVQTNSSNLGFNTLDKWKYGWDYAVCDLRELSLWNNPQDREKVAVTLGPDGARWRGFECPSFADKVIDATGAGDAFFAITSLLAKTGCDPLLTLFIGNVFAGLKTKIVGNARAVTKAELLKACEAILKV